MKTKNQRKLETLIPEVVTLNEFLVGLVVLGLKDDSRCVTQGDLFFAIKGLTVDGHEYAKRAADAGAVAVVSSCTLDVGVPCIVVSDPVRALGFAASRFNGEPSKHLALIGITGTNGKTTTSYVVESILTCAGRSPGVIGTVSYRFGGHERTAPFTTPTPILLQDILGQMTEAKCRSVVLEASSHALQLGRVWGCEFSVAAFTQLTQDHLDLHGDLDSYLKAKLLLFEKHLRSGGTAVVNLDGNGAKEVVDVVEKRGDLKLISCSVEDKKAKIRLKGASFSLDGLKATLETDREQIQVQSPLVGAFNAENILLAAGCSRAVGTSWEHIKTGIASLRHVPGRLERVGRESNKVVFVDFAHTPDAIQRVLDVLRPFCHSRLILVFGCGGDRDQSKRPLMGKAAVQGADLVIVTSDNPRSEDPRAIINQILSGIKMPKLTNLSAERGVWVEQDRAKAIHAAVGVAREGDVVLIAGKGHEAYQESEGKRVQFDDREQVRKALKIC
ncbi:MAG: UDP-N-acetylmuramoyl-L-alanyl-D-glutamate--2,6-diaminopimelate ligase [Pseudomonadota bacterium]